MEGYSSVYAHEEIVQVDNRNSDVMSNQHYMNMSMYILARRVELLDKRTSISMDNAQNTRLTTPME